MHYSVRVCCYGCRGRDIKHSTLDFMRWLDLTDFFIRLAWDKIIKYAWKCLNEYIFADGIQDSKELDIRCLELGHDALEKSELQNQIFSKLCINFASCKIMYQSGHLWESEIQNDETLLWKLDINLFVTSKNEAMNSPIHEFKALHKGQRAFWTHFLMAYYFLFIT